MRDINRRQFMRNSGSAALSAAAVASLPALLAACGSSDDSNAGTSTGGSGGGSVSTPRFGLSSSPLASYVTVMSGPIDGGRAFGLDATRDDFTIFDSSTTVTQSALSGRLAVVGQSTMAHLLLIERGLPFKLIVPYILSDDFVIATGPDVTSIEQLRDVVVATDSPGGAGTTILDAILLGARAGFMVSDLSKKVVIESSGERTSALANGDCEATIIHLPQANSIPADKRIHTIGELWRTSPDFLKECYAARTDWIDDNIETAAALAAGLISNSRVMSRSFADWDRAVQTFIEEPPPANEMREIFPLIEDYAFWPTEDDGGLTDARVQFMIDLGRSEGLIRRDLTVDDVVDRRPLQRAAELLASAR
jgi:ABC-type nitrate/sulfonate/bicarbonate transport system substrate-binding protein